MTIRTSLDGPRLAWTLAAAAVVVTVLGQVLSWGSLAHGRPAPWQLRMLLILTAVLVAAWVVLRPVLAGQDVSRRSLRTMGAAVLVVALGSGAWAVVLLLGALSSAPGSWLAVCGPVLAVLTVVVLELPRLDAPRAVTVLAVTAAVLALVGTLWWPDRMVDSSTTSALRSTTPAVGTRVAWSASTSSSTVYTARAGRPIVLRRDGCRTEVQGLDPRTGTVAWSYRRAGCRYGEVTGTDTILQARFDAAGDDEHDLDVYLDPATGEVLHPDPGLDDVTDWVGDYGVVALDPDEAYRSRRPEVAVLDARTGRTRVTAGADGCASDQQLVTPSPSQTRIASLDRFVAVGDDVAGGYVCVSSEPAADGTVQIQRHVLLLDPRHGTSGDVALPAVTEETGLAPDAPALAAAGDTVVAGYPIHRRGNLESQDALFGVTTAGVAWQHVDLHEDNIGDVGAMYAVGDVLVGQAGVLDARTGGFRAGTDLHFGPWTDATAAATVDGTLVSLWPASSDGGAQLTVSDPGSVTARRTPITLPADRFVDTDSSTAVRPISGGVLVQQSGGVAAVLA